MATSPAPEKVESNAHGQHETKSGAGSVQAVSRTTTHDGEDILGLQDLDPALNRKMHLVNNVRTTMFPVHHPL